MKYPFYDGDFENWKDVCTWFNMNEPEPDEVLVAIYDIDGYDGYAHVVYRNGRKYYLNYGSHCSCYGLEDQWEPEEFSSKKLLIAFLEKSSDDWKFGKVNSELAEYLKNR